MNESMDRALADWLREGPESGPRESVERALAATRRTSQRPGWTFPERWLPMQLTMQRAPSTRPVAYLAIVALLVLAVVATLLVVGSQRRLPPPFGPARNGAVVFEQGGDLLIADALNGANRTLVAGPESDTFPVFSNQGDRVAFVRQADGGFGVLSVRPDGSDVRQLASFPGTFEGLRWSPDGSALLASLTETDHTGFRLAVINADGSGSRELDLGLAADWASWRPDGSLIAFRGQLGDGTSAAFIADAQGAEVRQLQIETAGLVDFEGLSWSPDGARLSFMSDGSLGGTTGWQIGIADIDPAGNLTALRRLKLDPESGDEMLPHWSPDGTQFAFILMKEGVYQIGIARPDGSGLRLVGPRTVNRNGLGYAWAPDGRSILIASASGKASWWLVDVASGEATGMEGPTPRIPAWQRLAP